MKTHSDKFYAKKFKEYTTRMEEEIHLKGNTPLNYIKNVSDFAGAWDAAATEAHSKHTMKHVIDTSLHASDYKTAIAVRQQLRAGGHEVTSLKELRKMDTQEIAAKYISQIEDDIKALTEAGMSKKETRRIISRNWFGSK